MYTIDQSRVRKILVEEEKYSTQQVDTFLATLHGFNDVFQPVIEKWLETREIVDIEVEGLTLKKVMKTRNSAFLPAVRDLNFLLDESLSPEKRSAFKKALQQPLVRL
jgi:hypothetical protein